MGCLFVKLYTFETYKHLKTRLDLYTGTNISETWSAYRSYK